MPVDRRSFLGGLAALAVGGGLAARETQVADLVKGQAPAPILRGDNAALDHLSINEDGSVSAAWVVSGPPADACAAARRDAVLRWNESFEDWMING